MRCWSPPDCGDGETMKGWVLLWSTDEWGTSDVLECNDATTEVGENPADTRVGETSWDASNRCGRQGSGAVASTADDGEVVATCDGEKARWKHRQNAATRVAQRGVT